MPKKIVLWVLSFLLFTPSFAYRIEDGAFYLGGGFGVHVNSFRFNEPPLTSPGVQLPLIANVDYAIDRNFGVFGSFSPHFGAGNLGLSLKGGGKYWFSFLDTPYVPYVSLALVNTVLFPSAGPVHYNLGLSPGVGINYFVVANFLVGAHVHFIPSVGFAGGEKKFEFATTAFFDVMLRL